MKYDEMIVNCSMCGALIYTPDDTDLVRDIFICPKDLCLAGAERTHRKQDVNIRRRPYVEV